MLRRSAFKLWLIAGIVMISCALVLSIWWASISGTYIDTVLWKFDCERLESVSFSPDGQTIVTQCNSHLCFYDAATGELVNSISLPVYPKSLTWAFQGPVYSHDGKRIAVPGSFSVAMINSQTTETERSFDIPEAQVYSVHFNQDDTQLLTSDNKRHVIIWDVETGKKLSSWETGECSSYGSCKFWLSATFSPDGEQVVTTDSAGNVILWDASNGEVIREFIGYEDVVIQAHFDTTGKKLVTAAYIEDVRVWDVDSGEILLSLDIPGWFSDAEFSPDGRHIAVAQWQPDPTSIRLYDAETGELVYTYSGYSEFLYDIAFHPNEPWLVGAGEPYIVNYLLPDGFPDN
jgi:WD40 repeat protein